MQNKEYGKDDWFRRTTWTPEDKEAFFARLKRSRGQFHKAQYLRIQARYLQNEYPGDALALLEKVTSEYPEPSELASTYLQTAHCLIALEKKEEAIPWFRKVLEQESEFKNALTDGYIDFPMFIITNKLVPLYSEAKEIVEKNMKRLMFPVDHYRWNLVLAVIEDHLGYDEKSAIHATRALEASEKKESGFRYHPKIGLVKKVDDDLSKFLKTKAYQVASHNDGKPPRES